MQHVLGQVEHMLGQVKHLLGQVKRLLGQMIHLLAKTKPRHMHRLSAACLDPSGVWFHCLGLLANLTCIQAELYEMESAMLVGVDPLWVVPYTTVAVDFQYLLDDYSAFVEVGL